MKKQSINFCLLALLALVPSSAFAETFFIFRAAISVPVDYVDLNVQPGVDVLRKRVLGSKEIVNLALGRPLDAKSTEPNREILAFAIAYEQSTNQGTPTTPKSKLIVWDSTASGTARVRTVVGQITVLDYDILYPASGKTIAGQGLATGTLNEGTLDPSGKNKIFASTLQGAARASHKLNNTGEVLDFPLSLTALSGRVRFKYTDAKNTTPIEINGIVTKGSAKAMGKALTVYNE